MTRTQLVLLHAANVAVSGTGLAYAWMRYFLEPADEWAVVNHPMQPLMQHLHVLAAPTLVFAIGLIWSGHVVTKFRNGQRHRLAGVGLAVLFLPMAASGYLVQVSVDDVLRQRWIWVHVVTSLIWLAAFAVHQVLAAATRAQSGTEAPASVITAVQFGSPPEDSDGDAESGRHRIRSNSSGTSSASRAPSTSKGAGGGP